MRAGKIGLVMLILEFWKEVYVPNSEPKDQKYKSIGVSFYNDLLREVDYSLIGEDELLFGSCRSVHLQS